MLKLKTFYNVGTYCPTQWEGKTIDGREIYIRYRHGSLSCNLANNITQDALDGEMIYESQVSEDEYDGVMDDEEMKRCLSHLIDFNYKQT